jgi:hypothetical protein
MSREDLQRRKARALRLAILNRILHQIESGQFNNIQESTESVYPLHSSRTERFVPRGEYESPKERDTYNYGYTEIKELTGLESPNVWE